MQNTFMTVEDAAERLRVTPYTMRKWLRIGRVGGVKLGGQWRVPEASLTALTASATRLQPIAFASPDATEEEGAQFVQELRAQGDV